MLGYQNLSVQKWRWNISKNLSGLGHKHGCAWLWSFGALNCHPACNAIKYSKWWPLRALEIDHGLHPDTCQSSAYRSDLIWVRHNWSISAMTGWGRRDGTALEGHIPFHAKDPADGSLRPKRRTSSTALQDIINCCYFAVFLHAASSSNGISYAGTVVRGGIGPSTVGSSHQTTSAWSFNSEQFLSSHFWAIVFPVRVLGKSKSSLVVPTSLRCLFSTYDQQQSWQWHSETWQSQHSSDTGGYFGAWESLGVV